MSTRCLVCVKNEKANNYKTIYIHHDGYVEYVGFILNEQYNSLDKANELCELGNMSTLGCKKSTFEKMGYDNVETENSLYNEPYRIYLFDELIEKFSKSDCEYLYIFDNDKWTYTKWNWDNVYTFKSVEEELKRLKEENDN